MDNSLCSRTQGCSLLLFHSGTTDQCDRSMYIDSHSLALLLAIAVLSYLLGYLCSQMQFGDIPADGTSSRKQTPKD